jgi:anion-transporting  ArsA/GET3 family ATPase
VFVLVTRPEEERLPETLFFARRLLERGHNVGPIVVNMRHPEVGADADEGLAPPEAVAVMRWLGERDTRGVEAFRDKLPRHALVDLPLFPDEPSALQTLEGLREVLVAQLGTASV